MVDETVSDETEFDEAELGEDDEMVNCTRMRSRKMNKNLAKCMAGILRVAKTFETKNFAQFFTDFHKLDQK